MTALYIDADACPVKAEAERVANRHQVKMYVVSNGGFRPSQNPLVETIIVPDGPDVADMWIAERAGQGDVVTPVISHWRRNVSKAAQWCSSTTVKR